MAVCSPATCSRFLESTKTQFDGFDLVATSEFDFDFISRHALIDRVLQVFEPIDLGVTDTHDHVPFDQSGLFGCTVWATRR